MLPLADGLPAPNQSVVSNYLMQKLEVPYTMMHNGFRFSTRNWEAQYNYGAGFIQPPQTLAPHRSFPCYTKAPEKYPIPFNPGHGTLSRMTADDYGAVPVHWGSRMITFMSLNATDLLIGVGCVVRVLNGAFKVMALEALFKVSIELVKNNKN